jgi:ABC-2 type transport system ATP-binding protein
MSAIPVIETTGLSKRFGRSEHYALQKLDLEVREGEIFGLLGPNGAGKTTALLLLLDFIHPTSGAARLFGHTARDPRVRARVGYLPESLTLHTYYRGIDLLHFYGALLGMPRTERVARARILLDRLGLRAVENRRVSSYSKGTLQRLGFVQALLNDPDLLILDEPTSNLDPMVRREFSEILRELKARGKTILVSSHLLSEVETICDRVAILNKGVVARVGALSELLATAGTRLQVRRLPSELIERSTVLGAEVAIAADATTVRCPDAAVRERILAMLDREGIAVERTESETRSLEDLFVETVTEAA